MISFLLISPVLFPQQRREKEDQEMISFPLICPVLLPQQRREKEVQERFVLPRIIRVLLSHVSLGEERLHQHPLQDLSLLITFPTAVAMGNQKSVPFAWTLSPNRKLGHQMFVITYFVLPVSENGQGMSILARLIDRCLTPYFLDATRTDRLWVESL
jgi:hypothetical protein